MSKVQIKLNRDRASEIIVDGEPVKHWKGMSLDMGRDGEILLMIQTLPTEVSIDADGVTVEKIVLCPQCRQEVKQDEKTS